MRVLFLLFLILAPAYSSAQTVIFCQMEEHLNWDTETKKIKKFQLEKFKFSIQNEKTIKFGSSGSFSNFEMNIDFYQSPEFFKARTENTVLMYKNGKFNFSAAFSDNAGLVAATCDKF